MAGKKIGELTPLGRNLISTDELELSLTGSAGSRKITGAQIIAAAGSTQVGYKGFKYNMGYGEDYPSPPVPLAGQAFVLTDTDGYIQGIRISQIDADGRTNHLYLNRINSQPITIVYVDGNVFTYVAGLVTFVPGANPYYYMPPSEFSGSFSSGVAYIDYNTSLPALVSGTTIKTVNGATILGSGNLVISGGVTGVTGTSPVVSSGGATPVISMPAADAAGNNGYLTSSKFITFSNKQDALVSGTNIKTINSTSLLGSGDLALPVRPYVPYITPGFSYTNTLTGGGLAGGFAQTINKEGSLTPFTPLKTFTVSSFSLLAASYTDLVGGVIGIYQNSSGQQIGGTVNKVHQALLNLTSAASIYTVSSTFTFNAGVTYWIGYFVYTVPGGLGANLYVSDPRTMLPISSPVSLTQNIGYVINSTSISSTLPSSFDLSTFSQSSLKQFQIWWNVSSVL